MEEVLNEAFKKDLTKRPVSVLVLTAGSPDDSELLEKSLSDAAQKVADSDAKESPFIVRDIRSNRRRYKIAGKYLSHLNER